jgi:hypothetical protein
MNSETLAYPEVRLSRIFPPRDGFVFPGEQPLRLSMDVNTGSAGVLLPLGGHGTAPLFLEPSRVAASPVPTG